MIELDRIPFMTPTPRALKIAADSPPEEIAQALLYREMQLRNALEDKANLILLCQQYREAQYDDDRIQENEKYRGNQ